MSSTLEYQGNEPVLGVEGDVALLITEEILQTSAVSVQAEYSLVTEAAAEVQVLETPADSTAILESAVETGYVLETSAPRGEKGEPGVAAGSVVQYIVAYAMNGHRFVVLGNDQRVIYASNLGPTHAIKILGMTTGAAMSGYIDIQTGGAIEEPSWNWTLDTPVWLSVDGLMTQVEPTSGFSCIIGFPISATKLFINIREPIFLI